jgi:acetyltransferase-like isoleucine patch superfamily enzyme
MSDSPARENSKTQNRRRVVTEDPLHLVKRAAAKLNTVWLRHTYPFAEFGSHVSIHYSCDIPRSISTDISIGNSVYIAADVWLNVVTGSPTPGPKIILGEGCRIGRRSTISSANQITLEPDVLLAPSVLIMDHNHDFSNPKEPIHAQGVTAGGKITIGRNCWLGQGAVIICSGGELVLGRNSVVGANAVVTHSFPPYSVVAGNPAKLLKTRDLQTGTWVKA